MIISGLDDVPRSNIWICARCGQPITPFNYSGWEIFIKNGTMTQPICTLCNAVETECGEKEREENLRKS